MLLAKKIWWRHSYLIPNLPIRLYKKKDPRKEEQMDKINIHRLIFLLNDDKKSEESEKEYFCHPTNSQVKFSQRRQRWQTTQRW